MPHVLYFCVIAELTAEMFSMLFSVDSAMKWAGNGQIRSLLANELATNKKE